MTALWRTLESRIQTFHECRQRIDDEYEFLICSAGNFMNKSTGPYRAIPQWVEGILSSATEAIISVDENQRIILFNQAAEEIFQYQASRIVGESLDVLLPERYKGRHSEDVRRFGKGDQRPRRMASGRVIMARRADGTEFPAEASISRTVDDGHVIMTVIIRDVSDREAAIRRLADSEGRFRSLVDQFPGFVYTMEWVDLDAQKVPGITYASAAISRLVGMSPDHFYKHPLAWLDMIDQTMAEEALEVHRICLETGKPVDKLLHLVHAHGELVTVLNRAHRASILDTEKKTERAVLHGVMIDVTDRERLQQKLVQSERMAEAGRLAAIVAHEINSPITAIRGCFELLVTTGNLEPELAEYTEMALEEAKRVSKLAMRLRDYSLPSQVKQLPLSLNELITDIASMVEHELMKHNIAVVRDLEDHVEPVMGDARELKQVLWNLVANAWDAMPDGGRLVIRTRRQRKGRNVLFEVEDTGKGIAEDVQPSIFNMFFTTKNHSRSGGGAGLGLAISQKIVEQHRGTIEFESWPGEGTRFTVTLPTVTTNEEVELRETS